MVLEHHLLLVHHLPGALVAFGGLGERRLTEEHFLSALPEVLEALDIAGVDVLFDENGYRICEANSSPGFQGLERACDVDVPELVFVAMSRKFGLPLRHSARWAGAIERAAKAVLGPLPQPVNDDAPSMARSRRKRKPA